MLSTSILPLDLLRPCISILVSASVCCVTILIKMCVPYYFVFLIVQVNGITKNLPVLLNGGRVSIYASGARTFVSADFGLSVTFDGWSTVSISVPSN